MDNPPVVRVVVQVAFPPAPRLATSEALAELQERLPEGFQLQQQQASLGFQISIGAGAPAAPALNAIFAHPDGFVLSVGANAVALEIDHRYRDRAAFAAVLEPVLATIAESGRLKQYARIGVRYINAAPASIAQFRTWFKPEYVGWAGGDVVAGDADLTWVLITQIVRADEKSPMTNGIVRYGYLHNGVGADITTSAAADAASFIADIDLGDTRSGVFKPVAIAEKFRAINHEIAEFFEHSMTSAGIAHFALLTKDN